MEIFRKYKLLLPLVVCTIITLILGVILATTQFKAGYVDLFGCILIILLAADFFLPMASHSFLLPRNRRGLHIGI